MPYISQKTRDELIGDTKCRTAETPGELNYLISVLLDQYVLDHTDRYQTYNDIVGALEAAKLEFYRRLCVGYEDSKKLCNGDVYSVL